MEFGSFFCDVVGCSCVGSADLTSAVACWVSVIDGGVGSRVILGGV